MTLANPTPSLASLRLKRGLHPEGDAREAESKRKDYVRRLGSTCRGLYAVANDLLWAVVTVCDLENAQDILGRLERSPRLGSYIRAVIVEIDWDGLAWDEEDRMDEEIDTFRIDRHFKRDGSVSNWLHIARREHRTAMVDADSDDSDSSSDAGSAGTVSTNTLERATRDDAFEDRIERIVDRIADLTNAILKRCWRVELLRLPQSPQLRIRSVPSLRILELDAWTAGIAQSLAVNAQLNEVRILTSAVRGPTLANVTRLVLQTSYTFQGPDDAPKLTHLEVGVAHRLVADRPPFAISRNAVPTLRKLVLTGRPWEMSVPALLRWIPRTELDRLTVAFGPHDTDFIGSVRTCGACKALYTLREVIDDGSVTVDHLDVVDPYTAGPRPPLYELPDSEDEDEDEFEDEHSIAIDALRDVCDERGVSCDIDETLPAPFEAWDEDDTDDCGDDGASSVEF